MKFKNLFTTLIILSIVQNSIIYSDVAKEDQCNPGLLETYELEVIRETVDDENFICPGILDNCCTFESQLLIFNRWIKGHERDRLLHVYKTFIATFSLIFDDFKLVEQMANIVLSQKAPDAVTNCGEMAEAIKDMKASNLREEVLSLAKKAYRYIYDSRRGFYCSLCDADTHQNYDTLSGIIRISYGFCSGLIRETMGWNTFQYKFFGKIARLYGHFISTCSTAGKYDATHILKYDLKFFDNHQIIEDIHTCTSNLNDNSAIGICHEYCERFNPVKFDHMFEGQFDQLLAFRIWLNKMVVEKIYSSLTGFSKDDLSFTGRLLAEKKRNRKLQSQSPTTNTGSEAASTTTATNSPNTTAQHQTHDEPKDPFNIKHSSVNAFNEKYNTQAIDPITYSASEDFHATRLFDYEMSIFPTSKTRVYNLALFKAVLDMNGVNFLKFGYIFNLSDESLDSLSASINHARAIQYKNVTDPLSPNYGYRENSIQLINDSTQAHVSTADQTHHR